MLRVGLTGGIGSGKSEVSRRLAARGAAIVDADQAAREVVEPGTPGLGQIAAVFGPEVIRPDGRLDRDRLGELVFAEPAPAREAERHRAPPGARADAPAGRASAMAAAGPAGIVVHDVPLLAENGLAGGFDAVVVVDAPEDQQVQRLITERGMPAGQARDRMAAQASREQRLAIADIVIDNSGSPGGPGPARRRGLGRAARPGRRTVPRVAPAGRARNVRAPPAYSPVGNSAGRPGVDCPRLR